MIISKYERIAWEIVPDLAETERGEGGFGHTGTKMST
jgi:dUTPase